MATLGHDGRGAFYGEKLVQADDQTTSKEFKSLLTGDSVIKVEKLDATDYGKGFLETHDRTEALGHLGITSAMLEPGKDGAPGAPGAKGDKGDPGEKGDKGDIGVAGPRGVQGLPGEKGDPGPQGLKGDPGTKGDPGLKGDKGDPGPRGQEGLNGERGPKGDPGDKGETGTPGTPGAKGDKGDKGDRGEPGVAGPSGLNWKGPYDDAVAYVKDDLVGYQGGTYFSLDDSTGIPPLPENEHWAIFSPGGAKGDKGDKGDPGEKGDPGTPGAKGDPGGKGDTGDRGPIGDEGPQGPQGIQGERGIPGEKGDKGDPGIQGNPGIQGDTGPEGPRGGLGDKGDKGDPCTPGLKGDKGDPGIQGVPGERGPQGIQGNPGTPGIQGPAGDPTKMTDQQIITLKGRLDSVNPDRWRSSSFRPGFQANNDYYVKVGDTNLRLYLKNDYGSVTIYYARHNSNMDATATIRHNLYGGTSNTGSVWLDENRSYTTTPYEIASFVQNEIYEANIYDLTNDTWHYLQTSLILKNRGDIQLFVSIEKR